MPAALETGSATDRSLSPVPSPVVASLPSVSSPGGDQKALITGGAGFIGSHLAELLLREGWEVWALDDLSTGVNRNVEALREQPGFHLVVDSILSRSVVSELVHRVDVVYHLAAAVGVRLIVEQPVHTMVTNVQGTETVLEYCNSFGKRVLIASSSEVYGDHREERPLSEDDRPVDVIVGVELEVRRRAGGLEDAPGELEDADPLRRSDVEDLA